MPPCPMPRCRASWLRLREQEGIAARALEFTILTAARTGEMIGARMGRDRHCSTRLWTVPAERMKAGKEHRVPLSASSAGDP